MEKKPAIKGASPEEMWLAGMVAVTNIPMYKLRNCPYIKAGWKAQALKISMDAKAMRSSIYENKFLISLF